MQESWPWALFQSLDLRSETFQRLGSQKEKIAVTQGSGIEDTFIKTTYDNSLDSQISLLPLGFSLLFSPAVITSCHSLNHGPPGQRKGRRERRNQRSLKRKTGRTAGSTTNRRTCNSKSRESSGSASRTGKSHSGRKTVDRFLMDCRVTRNPRTINPRQSRNRNHGKCRTGKCIFLSSLSGFPFHRSPFAAVITGERKGKVPRVSCLSMVLPFPGLYGCWFGDEVSPGGKTSQDCRNLPWSVQK